MMNSPVKTNQIGGKGTIRIKNKNDFTRCGKFGQNEKIYEELLSFLEEYETDIHTKFTSDDICFRRIDKKKDPHYIHPNQLLTAKIIVLYFILGKLCHEEYEKRAICLIAEMQSGKTGTYASVIYIICVNEWIRSLLGITNIVVFSGMNDKNLYSQMKDDINQITNCDYLQGVVDSDSDSDSDSDIGSDTDSDSVSSVISNPDQCKLLILKNSGVKDMVGILNNTNTLYIHDESDYASSEGQKIDELFSSIDVNLNGTELDAKNGYLLSVSATPFADIHINNIANDRKAIITLETDNKYKSIKGMKASKKIREQFKFLTYTPTDLSVFEDDLDMDDLLKKLSNAEDERGKTDIKKKIKSLKDKHKFINHINKLHSETKKPMYVVIRAAGGALHDFLKGVLSSETNYNIREFNQASNTKEVDENVYVRNGFYNKRPKTHTIILIKQLWRMGNQVKKMRYITEMHDNCKNLDQLVQSFAGRCCGYKEHDIVIYCNVALIDEYIKIRNTNYELPPSKARHIKSTNESEKKVAGTKSNIITTAQCDKKRAGIIKHLNKRFPEEMEGCTIGPKFKSLRGNYIPCTRDGGEWMGEMIEGKTFYKYRLIQTGPFEGHPNKIWPLEEFMELCLSRVPCVKPGKNAHNHHLIHRYPVVINEQPRFVIVFWNGNKKVGIVDDGVNGKGKAFNAI